MRFCSTIKPLVFLTLAFSALSCNNSSSSDPAPSNPFAPVVNAVTPNPAKTGETLTVTGTNLNAPDAVRIGKTVVTPTNITATSFKIVVPSNAVTGKLFVFNSFGADSSKTITLSAGTVLKPSVTTVSPT
ncbi:MAG: IPT/TIG domain-containing protein, partial [Flexibacteraceae bacterium]